MASSYPKILTFERDPSPGKAVLDVDRLFALPDLQSAKNNNPYTTVQSNMNAKLNQQKFYPYYKNGLSRSFKSHPTSSSINNPRKRCVRDQYDQILC